MLISASLVVFVASLIDLSLATPTTLRHTRMQESDVHGLQNYARQASGVTALTGNIDVIAANLTAANKTVSGFQKGGIKAILGLAKINSAVVNLGDSISATTKTASSIQKLNVADSTTVGVKFLNVQPSINSLLTNLQGKRADLDGAAFGLLDVRSLIRDSLSGQQMGATNLGNSLIKALDPSLAPIAMPIVMQIQGNFTSTVKSFDGRSGVIKIPTQLVPAVSDLLDEVTSALGLTRRDNEAADSITFVDRAASGYCCGITQDKIDALGSDESDYSNVPLPVKAVLKKFGM